MSVMDRIKPALARATSKSDAPVNDPQACLTQMLDTIETVVLPRDVTLENGAGQCLSLTVKSRRLIRVNGGALNTELGADQAPELAKTFADFAAKARELKTHMAEPARPDVLSELGVPVGTLRQALVASEHLAPQEIRSVMPDLKHLAKAHDLTCAFFTDGGLEASNGDIHALQAAHDTALPHILKTEQPGQGRAASWVLGTGSDRSVAIALEGSHCFLADLPSDLTQHWIKTCATRQA